MSTRYTVQFLSWQGLNPGDDVRVAIQAKTPPVIYAVRWVQVYFGSPSPLLDNSAVLVDVNADNGQPTIWGYNSGTTSSTQSIYRQDAIQHASLEIDALGEVDILRFANTSGGTTQVDVCIAGWIISGSPNAFIFAKHP